MPKPREAVLADYFRLLAHLVRTEDDLNRFTGFLRRAGEDPAEVFAEMAEAFDRIWESRDLRVVPEAPLSVTIGPP